MRLSLKSEGWRTATIVGAWVFLHALFGFAHSTMAAMEAMRLQGSAKMRLYSPDGARHEQATMLFTLNVAGCGWVLRFARDYQGSDGAHAPDSQEISCDGTNIYFLSNFKSEFERLERSGMAGPAYFANGITYEGQVFHHRLADEVGAIWLTYAAACYLRAQTNSFIEPAMAFDGFGNQYGPSDHSRLRAQWTLTPSEPIVPLRVVYFGGIRHPAGKERATVGNLDDRAITNAIYQVEAFTNIGGLRLPCASSLTLFTLERGGTTSHDLRLLAEYRVELTNAGRDDRTLALRPTLPGVALLSDLRGGRVYYFATNEWPSTWMVRTGAYFQELRRINVHPARRRHSALPVRILLVLIIAVPVWVYLLRRPSRGSESSASKV